MTHEYLQNNLLKSNSIEARDYQISLAMQAKTQNSLVVLPTGLGKTTIALQVILDILSNSLKFKVIPSFAAGIAYFEFLLDAIV